MDINPSTVVAAAASGIALGGLWCPPLHGPIPGAWR